MDVLEITRALWRKKWLIIAMTLITAVVTLVLLKYKKEKYNSVAQLSTGYTVRNAADLSDDNLNQNQTGVKFSNLMALMNSPISFDLLSYRLLLHDLDSVEKRFRLRSGEPDRNPVIEISNALKEEEEGVFDFLSNDESKLKLYLPENIKKVKRVVRYKLRNLIPLDSDDPDFELVRSYLQEFGYGFNNIRENTAIYRLGNTDYIQVEFTSENSHLSAYAANAFCQEFIRYYNSLMSENTGESVQILKKRIDEKEAEIEKKLETLQTYKSSNNILNSDGEGGTRVGQLIDLENQRDEIRSRLHELELTMERLRDELASLNTSSANSSNIRIVNLQDKINELNSQYMSGGSNDAKLRDSLNTLRQELRLLVGSLDSSTPQVSRSEVQSQLKDAEIDYKVQRNRLSVVNSKLQDLKYSMDGYSSKGSKAVALQREIDMLTEKQLELVNRYNIAKNDLASTSLRQARIATPSLNPVSMKNSHIMGMAIASGLALGVFVVVLMEVLNFSIKTPSKFQRLVNIPHIGSLNKINTNSFDIHKQFMSKGPNSAGDINKSLLRQIRYEIESLNSKVLLFTSLKANEGKTFAIFCAAYVLSLLNKRVLIIDTNFKSNKLTQLYGKDLKDIKVIQKMVPSKLLNEKAESDMAEPQMNKPIYKLVNPTKYKNVFFIGNIGIANSSPSEILSSKDFKSFIEIMKERYDYVLLEGASLNDHSDTKELVDYADKVISVISAESILEPIDNDSVRYLKSLDGKLAGGILNKVHHKDLKL